MRDRARRFTAVLLADAQMLRALEAVGDKQREEISGRAHRFDSSSRRVNLTQRIKRSTLVRNASLTSNDASRGVL